MLPGRAARELNGHTGAAAARAAHRKLGDKGLFWGEEITRRAKDVAAITMQVKVKPNARASSLTQAADGLWQAQLKAPPVDGKANQELIGLVARHFGCPKAAVSIRSGASGRLKLVKVEIS